jgi:hypothetical protein
MILADGVTNVEAACRLNPDLLACVLRTEAGFTPPDELTLNERWHPIQNGTADRAPALWLLTVRSAEGQPMPDEVYSKLSDSARFANTCGAALNGAERLRAASFLAEAPNAHGVTYSPALGEHLLTIRDVLRPSLPASPIRPGVTSSMRLDQVLRLGDRAFWLLGWIHDPQPASSRFTAVSPEGIRVVPREGAVSFHVREGIDQLFGDDPSVPTVGFSVYVEPDVPSHHPTGWILEFRNAAGDGFEDAARRRASTEIGLARRLLGEKQPAHPDEATFAGQVLPISRRLTEHPDSGSIEEMRAYGELPAAPEVSVVIATPAIDRIEHQLLELARDPGIEGVEIVYAIPRRLDDGELDAMAEGLCSLHRIPFRIVRCSPGASIARAFNLGASIAGGRLIVLMGGDALPTEPGWLQAMCRLYDSDESVGAVGPLLLHEDGSVAHAGASYVRDRGSGTWARMLTLRGLSPTLAGATSTRRTAAVSESCMMVAADHLTGLGGLCELYLGDGDEGGDLCMGLAHRGLDTWFVSDAKLHILERDIGRARSTEATRAFDAWLFATRWGSDLTRNEGEEGEASAAGMSRATPVPAIVLEAGPVRPGSLVEVVRVECAGVDGIKLLDASLDPPDGVRPRSLYEDTYSLVIEGWALTRSGAAPTIELLGAGGPPKATVASLPRSDVGARYADSPGADSCGFQFVISSLSLPLEFELEIRATPDGAEPVLIGRLVGRRRPLQSGYRPVLEPLIITTLGRTGSVWLVTLLSRHPKVVACAPFEYEGALASYWMEILQTLSEPQSYIQEVRPERAGHHWWLGEPRQSPLPLRSNDVAAPRWLGRENVEILAGFSQCQFDRFYTEIARQQRLRSPRYFTEKTTPGTTPRLLSELYPDGREIVLVRDFRDRVCSVLAYNAKRGLGLWGRDTARTDEEWFSYLRAEAVALLREWRERRSRAHLVRYEDLITDPALTLSSVFSYLGVDSRPGTIRRILEEARGTGRRAQAYHRTSTSISGSVGRWKSELSLEHQQACAAAFDDILTEFGYEATVTG